ncbi:Vps54-domain-containing protein [Pseudovirgaria hyperparasitica]|uniref:Vps54-domain-containing protein n=1 Tax=Pseudovirgaria hyperparasitica TaxID=470096 RepID=A0A6A6W6I6_9PEZI|nr:Vps54-domain-containing protein [Pseudovirgaria hyperparasitica]KAF2757570.1 Vps54-domain-containing protein [Pseudovirgaria hyperparasitica]
MDVRSCSSISATARNLQTSPNAISTLLQPPIARSGLVQQKPVSPSALYRIPTARDIPPVVLTSIPPVETREFDSYVERIGPIYNLLRSIGDRRDDCRETDKSGRIKCLVVDEDANPLDGTMRDIGGLDRRSKHDAPSLATIPVAYFDEQFDLRNPRTFDIVSERSELMTSRDEIGAVEPRKALATNAILQEKLSWYIDIAEVHLINSLSTAATPISSTFASLEELHIEAAELVENIAILRKDLASLDENLVAGGLRLLQKKRMRHNLQQLQDAMQQLERIAHARTHAKLLVEQGQTAEALTEIDAIDMLIVGERDETVGIPMPRSRLRDLRGVTSLQGYRDDLDHLRVNIGDILEAQVLNFLIDDLRNYVRSVQTEAVVSRWRASPLRSMEDDIKESLAFSTHVSHFGELRTSLVPAFHGLHKSRSIPKVIRTYRDAMNQEILNFVHKLLSSSDDDPGSVPLRLKTDCRSHRMLQERTAILTRIVRSLKDHHAEELLLSIFIGITETLRRIQGQTDLLLDMAAFIGTTALQDEIRRLLDTPSIFKRVVTSGCEQIIEILQIRSEQTIQSPLTSFVRYYASNSLFVKQCEAILGQQSTSLRTVIDRHAKDYVRKHGNMQNETLAQQMNSDIWQDEDFTTEDNKILDQVLHHRTLDSLHDIGPQYSSPKTLENEAYMTENAQQTGKVRGAIIDNESFLIPKAAILCLRGTSHFLRLSCGIPTMATETTMSLISYLRLFDSRCRQLVLGAGAIYSAGLAVITHTNLISALQAIRFMASIIPHIRDFAQRTARSDKKLSDEFDKVQRTFREHQEAIYEKLVEILKQRARVLSRQACEIEWNLGSPTDVRQYMTSLTKDTGKIYRALSKRCPSSIVLRVMTPVFACYREHFVDVFKKADPVTNTGRECMLRDVKHLVDKCGEMEGYSDLGTTLLLIVETKETDGTSHETQGSHEKV